MHEIELVFLRDLFLGHSLCVVIYINGINLNLKKSQRKSINFVCDSILIKKLVKLEEGNLKYSKYYTDKNYIHCISPTYIFETLKKGYKYIHETLLQNSKITNFVKKKKIK